MAAFIQEYQNSNFRAETLKAGYIQAKAIPLKTEKDGYIGYLELLTVGRHNTWGLFLDKNCYLTARCQDLVREKTRELNAKYKKKIEQVEV